MIKSLCMVPLVASAFVGSSFGLSPTSSNSFLDTFETLNCSIGNPKTGSWEDYDFFCFDLNALDSFGQNGAVYSNLGFNIGLEGDSGYYSNMCLYSYDVDISFFVFSLNGGACFYETNVVCPFSFVNLVSGNDSYLLPDLTISFCRVVYFFSSLPLVDIDPSMLGYIFDSFYPYASSDPSVNFFSSFTNAIGGTVSALGSGVSNAVSSLFIDDGKLSAFGFVCATFGGISVALGLCALGYRFVVTIGGKKHD